MAEREREFGRRLPKGIWLKATHTISEILIGADTDDLLGSSIGRLRNLDLSQDIGKSYYLSSKALVTNRCS